MTANSVTKYEDIIKQLHNYCMNENYKGYNLLDSHNSFIPFAKFGNTISFYTNQFFRRSPINLRPLFGIKKTINPKAIGLFLYSYTKLNDLEIFKKEELSEINNKFFRWLETNYCKGYKGYCWGYQYDWPQRKGKIVKAGTPNVIVTGNIVRALYSYYKVYNVKKAKEVIKSAADFVINDLTLTRTSHGLCFSYTSQGNELVVNANLMAAEILSYADYTYKTNIYENTIKGVLDFTKNLQNSDGSWFYSYNPTNFQPSKQIDFHQGNVLESLYFILRYNKTFEAEYSPIFLRGLAFYKKEQFKANGASIYRLPKIWPIDIHNQAEGILVFSRFSEIDNSFLPFAQVIAEWTLNNLRSPKGFFYFQKWPFFRNKISYMRWNQAWMMVALVELLISMRLRTGSES